MCKNHFRNVHTIGERTDGLVIVRAQRKYCCTYWMLIIQTEGVTRRNGYWQDYFGSGKSIKPVLLKSLDIIHKYKLLVVRVYRAMDGSHSLIFYCIDVTKIFNERKKIKSGKCNKRIITLSPFKAHLKRPLACILMHMFLN